MRWVACALKGARADHTTTILIQETQDSQPQFYRICVCSGGAFGCLKVLSPSIRGSTAATGMRGYEVVHRVSRVLAIDAAGARG